MRAYDLGDERQLGLLYESVLRESTDVVDMDRYLNAAVLRRVWLRLWLPARLRQGWEQRFPEIGAVLHPDDAVANKLAALYGRAADRDYVDVDAVLQSGRYSSADLLRLAREADPRFDQAMFVQALLAANRVPDHASNLTG